MQITFGSGPRRRVYEITDWVCEYPDPWTIMCRPGVRTFFRRLAFAGLVAALAAGILMPVWKLNDPIAQPVRVCGIVIVALAIVYAASVLWQRVRIFRIGDDISVQSFSFLPRVHTCPVASLVGMNVLEQEVRSSMKSGYRRLGWRWRVLLNSEDGGFEFWCDHQADRSQAVPRRVGDFVGQLQRTTGLSCEPPQTIKWRSGRQGAFRTGRRIVTSGTPENSHRVFHSLDEMPPDIRAQAEAAMSQMRAQGLTSIRQEQVTIMDSNGHVQTYNSLDEMPPEVRRRFESARQRSHAQEE